MRYEIFIDGTDTDDGLLLHDSRSSELEAHVTNAILSLEDSKAGSLNFEIDPEHPYYNSINRLTSYIDIYQTDSLPSSRAIIWSGRVLQEEIDFNRIRVLYCEGELAYLNDTCQPQMEYKDSDPKGIMQAMLDVHNQRVDDKRKFYLKPNNASFPSLTIDPITFTTQYGKSLDAITELANKYKWHIHIERAMVDGHRTRYLVFTENATYETNTTQTIQFGENLIDYTGSFDLSEMATVLIPLGQKTSSAGQTLIGDLMDWSQHYDNQYFDENGDSVQNAPGYHIGEVIIPEELYSTVDKPKYVYFTGRNDQGHAMYLFRDRNFRILAMKTANNSRVATDCVEEKIQVPIIEAGDGPLTMYVSGFDYGLTMRVNAQKDVDQVFDEYTTVESVNDGSVYVMAESINLFKSELIPGSISHAAGVPILSTSQYRNAEPIDIQPGTYTQSSMSNKSSHEIDIFFYDKENYGGTGLNVGADTRIQAGSGDLVRTPIDPSTGTYEADPSNKVLVTDKYMEIPYGPCLIYTEGATYGSLKARMYLYVKEENDTYTYRSIESAYVNYQSPIMVQCRGTNNNMVAIAGGTTIALPAIPYGYDKWHVKIEFYSTVDNVEQDLPDNAVTKGYIIHGYTRLGVNITTGEFEVVQDSVLTANNMLKVGKGPLTINRLWRCAESGNYYKVKVYFYKKVIDPDTAVETITYDDQTSAEFNQTDHYVNEEITIPYNGYIRVTFVTWNQSTTNGTNLDRLGFCNADSNTGYELHYLPNESLYNKTLYFTFTVQNERLIYIVYKRRDLTDMTADDVSHIQLEKSDVPHTYESPKTPLDIYGWFERQVTWDDTTDPQVLKDRAVTYLKSGQFDKMTITIKAYDLALMNVNAESIKLGQTVRVTSKPHGLDRYFDVTKMEVNLSNWTQTTYTLGYEQDFTLTGSSNQINETLTSLISGESHNALINEMRLTAAAQILGANGGGVTTILNDDNRPVATMYSETPPSTPYLSKMTAADKGTRCIFVNYEGMAFYERGFGDWPDNPNPPTITLVNGSGQIVANAIAAGTMLADRIRGGVLQLDGYDVIEDETTVHKYANIVIPAPDVVPSGMDPAKFRDRWFEAKAFEISSTPNDEYLWIYDGTTNWTDVTTGSDSKPRWIKIVDACIVGGDRWKPGGEGTPWVYNETTAIWPNFSWGPKWDWTDAVGPCICGTSAVGICAPNIVVSTQGMKDNPGGYSPTGGEHPNIGSFRQAASNQGMEFVNDFELDVSTDTITIEGQTKTVVTGVSIRNKSRFAAEFVNGFYMGDHRV